MKKIFLCTLGLSALLFSACEKEDLEYTTDCDEIVIKVTEISQDYDTVDLYYDDTNYLDEPYNIQGKFIEVEGTLYNLCMVRKMGNDNNSIVLHF